MSLFFHFVWKYFVLFLVNFFPHVDHNVFGLDLSLLCLPHTLVVSKRYILVVIIFVASSMMFIASNNASSQTRKFSTSLASCASPNGFSSVTFGRLKARTIFGALGLMFLLKYPHLCTNLIHYYRNSPIAFVLSVIFPPRAMGLCQEMAITLRLVYTSAMNINVLNIK